MAGNLRASNEADAVAALQAENHALRLAVSLAVARRGACTLQRSSPLSLVDESGTSRWKNDTGSALSAGPLSL